MPTKNEIDHLAKAINVLRPEWPIPSLTTYIARNHQSRPYADLAIALTAVAVDPASKTPKRVEEAGPWWQAAQVAFAGVTTPHVGPGRERCTKYGHEHYPAHNCPGCRIDELIGPQAPDPLPTDYDDARTRAAGEHP